MLNRLTFGDVFVTKGLERRLECCFASNVSAKISST
jgi:hypothetical protein